MGHTAEDVDLESCEIDESEDEHFPLMIITEEPATNAADWPEDAILVKKGKIESGERKNGGKIIFLNGLRGLAALLVVGQHGYYYNGIDLGGCGVDIFFVLSAFLLTMLFERKSRQMLQQSATLPQWLIMLIDYFSKRFFRVYPLFATVAIIYALLSDDMRRRYLPMDSSAQYDLFEVLTFKFEARYHVFWTLPVEIGYYFLIPVFVFFMVGFCHFWWILALPMFFWILHERSYTFRWNHQPLAPHLSTFVTGSLAAFVYGRIDKWLQDTQFEITKWHRWGAQVLETFLLGVLLYCAFNDESQSSLTGNAFVCVYVAILIVVEMVVPSWLSRFFEWNFFVHAGKISFSIYLLHSFVIYTPEIMYEKKFHCFLYTLSLTWVLATASYWIIEYPSHLCAQRVSKWLRGLSDGPRPAAVVAAVAKRVISRRRGKRSDRLEVVVDR